MEDRIYTVTNFNRMLKEFVETNSQFSNFFVIGEMSSVTYYKSGHLYFSLKDKNAQIKCAAFNFHYKKIPENLKDGDQVKIFCDLGVYENRGEIQLLVRYIEKQNRMGEKFLELEALKKELEKDGYFSLEHKKKLPKYPKNIGVVTSASGAALQDIIKTVKKRDDRINIYLYPAKVQGDGAKEEIIKGIEALNKIPEIDFIIAGRGGGSIEDLWCFNEKEVALAFFYSSKPIISAVGHEIDILLSDLTADIRAATPTQAVELSVPEKSILKENLNNKIRSLEKTLNFKLLKKRKEYESLENNYILKNFYKELLKTSDSIAQKESILSSKIKLIINKKEREIAVKAESLVNKNPVALLAKGYSMVFHKEERINSIEELKENDLIKSVVSDGIIYSRIEELKKSENK